MTDPQWQALEERALWILGHGDQAPPREGLQGMAPQLRLWRYRPGARYTSWSIFLSARDSRAKPGLVRELSWDRPADRKIRLPRPSLPPQGRPREPSIRIRDAQVAWSELGPFLEEAGGLQREAPPAKGRRAAGDQDSVGLEGFRSYAHVHLEWTGRPRREAAAAAWLGRFRALLIGAIRDRDAGRDP